MVEQAFGEAGKRIVIEEWLDGQEASILAIIDGSTIVPLEPGARPQGGLSTTTRGRTPAAWAPIRRPRS